MELTWNLDVLYISFNSEKFKSDEEILNKHIANLNDWAIKNLKDTHNAASKIQEFLKLYNEYKSLYCCLYSYAELTSCSDSSNIQAMNVLDDIEDNDSSATESFVKFNKWLKSLNNIEALIESSPELIEYGFYIKELLSQSKYLLGENEESLISKMQITGSKAWQRLYMELTSTLLMDIDIDGESKKISLSELRNMAYEENESLRKIAYYAEVDACKSISKSSAACLNGISGEALTIYDMRGYKSPLEKVLLESRMDFETLNTMLLAVKESLPMFHKYYNKKSQILGHKESLPFYDIFAPTGDANTKISYLDARDLIVSSFKTFSQELANFAEKVFDKRWIDAELRT
ncbi:hypothetical protein [Clostridium lacusfryxellense]|uniref:hypothetical protein n=1 Tax=Clostridium lacusfryxellense TaxID=205328 RepID=UPI001C0DE189|nr:hypothetical protein [Clostridium lacusfryxellense]MBU3113051.1 hypothetical protein [Clostridium lacusfryxellense]